MKCPRYRSTAVNPREFGLKPGAAPVTLFPMPSIGIIMRTKNRPLLLERALRSVAGQQFDDWHLAVVNDGGEPEPVERLVAALPELQRKRVSVIHNAQSVGMEAASNMGLWSLETDYVMVHDDDDSLHPGFFRKTVDYLDCPPHPSVRGVITHTERIIERIEGDTVIQVGAYPYNDWLRTISLRRMLAGNVFAPIAFVVDRQACREVGAFREDLPVLGDWDFNVRFLARYEIGVIPEKLAYYHNREDDGTGNYSSSVNAKAHLHEFYDNLLRNEWLRKDIETGRTGLGAFANKGLMHWDQTHELREDLARRTLEIKEEIKKGRFRLFPKKKRQ